MEMKNADYGGRKDALNNFRLSETLGIPMDLACLIRMSDKMARISTLRNNEAKVKDESIEDTIKDLINYSAILLVILRSSRTLPQSPLPSGQ